VKNEFISKFLSERIVARDFPSAVYLVAERGEIVFEDALGFAVVEPKRIEARTDTIYDLASLTKPLVTGLLCAKLIEKNELNLEEIIEVYLPEFSTHPDSLKDMKRDTLIFELLTHISCFPNWKPFYLMAEDRFDKVERRNEILDLIIKTPLEFEKQVVYSDLNFLILTFLIEKIYGKQIDEVANEEIFAPLNLKNTFFNPLENLRGKIAASEKGNEFEKQMCAGLGYDVSRYDWRDYQIWGEVHDGNCYFMNGASGHAGLFSTAEETFKIARQFLPNTTQLLKPETCELFRTNFTENLNEARSIAFQLAATKDSTASRALSKNSFWHLGFTGTSLWIDPVTERIYILLTNRTHDRELPFANINQTRRRFHELANEFGT
jgi:serine-type D-Ala-D-Ala carboxypeptidase